MTDFHIRPDCRLCGSTYTEVLDLGETALANEVWDDPSVKQDVFPLKLVQCDACHHVQCPVVVDPKRLFGRYSYTSGLTESYREHLREYAKQIDAFLSMPGDLLVEIGGNDGTLGDFWGADCSVQYINVDPSDVPSPGVRFTEFFDPSVARIIKAGFGPARVIVANHVFAHSDKLDEMAEGVKELLAEDGTLFVEVGDGPTQLRGGLSVIYHEHLDYHSYGPFQKFWNKHGLYVHDAWVTAAQGGSLRLMLKRQVSSWMAHPYLNAFDLPAIKAKAAEMRGLGKALREMNSRFATDRCGVTAVYGCPAKLTTLFALLGEFKAPVIFDDSPRKVGKRAPGSDVPIIAPDPDAVNEFDFILIASWNFAESIMARYPGYTGTWVIPEPTVRFIPGGGA